MRMRTVGLGLLAAGVCFAVSSMAADGGGKKGGHGKGEMDPAARFAAADANSDGAVSLDEFKAAMAKRQEALKAKLGDKYDPAKAPDADAVFKKLDKDGNGSLSKEEFAAGGHRKPAPPKPEEAAPKAE